MTRFIINNDEAIIINNINNCYGETVSESRYIVMTKNLFKECYKKWILENEVEE